MANTDLRWTPSSSGTNRRKFTFSFWTKFVDVDTNQRFFQQKDNVDSAPNFFIGRLPTNELRILEQDGGNQMIYETSQVFRDVSAWYHIVVSVDTTDATASDRQKIYINGERVTSFKTSTNYPLNYDSVVSTAKRILIGSSRRNIGEIYDYSEYYLSEYYYIDGQTLDASYFGQTDSTGIWKSKGYSGTYGTNGFYLKFSNSGDLGADSSGNGNNFTKSGNGRQRTDTPSNVFATWNSVLYTSGGVTYSEGNTRIATNDPTKLGSATTLGASTGKWYCEMKIPGNAPASLNGVSYNPQEALRNAYHSGYLASSWGYYGSTGQVYNNNSASSYGNALVNNDILMIAMDLDNSKLYFGINGTWQNSGDPTSGATGTGAVSIDSGQTYFFEGGDAGSTVSTNIQLNTGNPTFTISSGNTDDNGYGNFEYAPPTGYLALCTKNLASVAAPTIDDGSQYFKTVTYTGNAPSSQTITTGLRPDVVWTKNRTNIADHNLYDTNRGDGLKIKPNQTETEASVGTDFQFGTTGFTVGDRSETNEGSSAMVSWNWNVNNGSTSSNSDGSITSTVQANQTAGFSIVTFTGDGNNNATVGHGLNAIPEIIIIKNRSSAQGWVFNANLSSKIRMNLNTTNGDLGDFTYYMGTQTSSNIVFNNNHPAWNGSGNDMVAYVFKSIEGYSKFGTYIGNALADGPFIYTGFKPAFVIIKNTGNTSNWNMLDSTRNTYNAAKNRLYPNLTNAEEVMSDGLDFVSNGFKLRQTSNNDQNQAYTYLYMAFAENPFVTSGGLPVTAR